MRSTTYLVLMAICSNITLVENSLVIESLKSSHSVILVLYSYVKQINQKKENTACAKYSLKCSL